MNTNHPIVYTLTFFFICFIPNFEARSYASKADADIGNLLDAILTAFGFGSINRELAKIHSYTTHDTSTKSTKISKKVQNDVDFDAQNLNDYNQWWEQVAVRIGIKSLLSDKISSSLHRLMIDLLWMPDRCFSTTSQTLFD